MDALMGQPHKTTENAQRAQALPFLLVTAGTLILFGPMLVTGRTLFWGTPLLQFVPWRSFALRAFVEGHLPLWNPSLGMGAPLLANYQTAIFYPPNWILPLTGIAWGQGLLVALHLILAGCGMTLLAKRLGAKLHGQTMAGLAFGISGYLVARAGFLSINATAAWLPWLVLSADQLAVAVAEKRPRREVGVQMLWLSLALMMQWLAGHAQTSWYSLLLVGAWALWRVTSRGGRRNVLRLLPWLVAAGVLAFALAAVQLVPTLEYMLNSHRAETIDPEFAMTYSFAPWRTLGLLFPDLFGNPARGDYWGYGNYWEDAIYIGVIPLLFALLALVRGVAGRDERKKLIRALGVVSLISFIFALGKNTPIFPWLFEHVPTFDLFQAPARWNLVPVFALSLIAAFGADAWRAPEDRTLYWMRLATAGAATVALAAWLIGALNPTIRHTFTQTFMVAGFWLFTFCLIALTRPAQLTIPWIALIGILVMADLGLANRGLNPTQPISLYTVESTLASRIDSEHRVYMPPDLEQELKFERTHRFDTFEPGVGWDVVRDAGLPNTTSLDDIPSANNFDPLLPERYSVWMQALEELGEENQLPYLRLMDVGWYAVEDTNAPSSVRYVAVEDPSRVRLVYEAGWEVTPEQALARVFESGFDPTHLVVLEGSGEVGSVEPGEGEVASFEQDGPNRIEIAYRSTQDAWLVLSDAWYPGWRADVDGEAIELLHADYLFRALRVPSGTHTVTFTYRPLSFIVGCLLSSLGLLALLGLTWLWRRD
jgi:uncharacterized membrane protein YfhO